MSGMSGRQSARARHGEAGRSPALLLILVIAATLALTGCKKKEMQKQPPTVPVTAAVAARKEIPLQVSAIGNVEAYSTVSVRAQTGGQLQRIHFTEGQDVRKGDLLFTIDPRPFEAALRQAEANLARNTAQMEHARQEARRYEELVKRGYVAQAQYDQIRTNASSLEALVKADTAAVENARLQLSYCFIHAPVSGRAGGLQVHQGNLVKANDEQPLVVIHQIQPIYVNFSLPEQHLPDIKRYQAAGKVAVTATVQNGGELPAQGALAFIDNAVDRTTGTIRLKGLFENRDRRLWPGQFASVTITLAVVPDAVVVPSPAVQTGQQGQYVFVVKNDTSVEPRPVKTGASYKGETVVETGIQPGERVVTDGHMRLMPGAKVEIKEGLVPAAPASAQGAQKP